jgi:hypothetical protein
MRPRSTSKHAYAFDAYFRILESAGAQAQRLFGDKWLTLFSVMLTLAILFFSEIIPKSFGARYWKSLIPFAARILPLLVLITYPLVFISEKISLLIKGKKRTVSPGMRYAPLPISVSRKEPYPPPNTEFSKA